MSDIVERLRSMQTMKHGNLMQEAAEEIERLRQEAANYKHALFSVVENVHKPQMVNAEAEIERLTTEREDYKDVADTLAKFCKLKDAEIVSMAAERDALRAALEDALAVLAFVCPDLTMRLQCILDDNTALEQKVKP